MCENDVICVIMMLYILCVIIMSYMCYNDALWYFCKWSISSTRDLGSWNNHYYYYYYYLILLLQSLILQSIGRNIDSQSIVFLLNENQEYRCSGASNHGYPNHPFRAKMSH